MRYALFEILGMVKVHEDLTRTSELIVFFHARPKNFVEKGKTATAETVCSYKEEGRRFCAKTRSEIQYSADEDSTTSGRRAPSSPSPRVSHTQPPRFPCPSSPRKALSAAPPRAHPSRGVSAPRPFPASPQIVRLVVAPRRSPWLLPGTWRSRSRSHSPRVFSSSQRTRTTWRTGAA